MELKQSVPGSNVVEVQFNREDPEWPTRLETLAGVTDVQSQSAGVYRVLTSNGSLTTTAAGRNGRVAAARHLTSLSVQNTIARRRLCALHRPPAPRRAGQGGGLHHAAAAGSTAMNRMMAIVEREMRKFFRSPVLMIMSMMLPLVQLVILGNAFGGKIRGARVARGRLRPRPAGGQGATRPSIRSPPTSTPSRTVTYDDEHEAREDVRTGKIDAAVIIPAQYSRRVYAQDAPEIGLVVDNSDQFMSSSASKRRCNRWSTRSIAHHSDR